MSCHLRACLGAQLETNTIEVTCNLDQTYNNNRSGNETSYGGEVIDWMAWGLNDIEENFFAIETNPRSSPNFKPKKAPLKRTSLWV